LEKAAEHGVQRGVKIKKKWDSPDGYFSGDPEGGEAECFGVFSLKRPILSKA
jgi:hypothetical protein